MKVQTKPVTPFLTRLWVSFLVTAMHPLKIGQASAKERWRFSTMQTISARVRNTEQCLQIHPQNIRTCGLPKAIFDLNIHVKMKPFVGINSPESARTLIAWWVEPWQSWASLLGSAEVRQRAVQLARKKD